MKNAFVILGFAILASCGSDPAPVVSEQDVTALGFKTVATRTIEQSDWDRKAFGEADIFEQDIKSLTEMKGHPNFYPRFTLIRETFRSREQAENRIIRLREHDSKIDSKMFPKLLLRDGFSAGKEVFIVTTDAVIFSHEELDKMTSGLKRIKSGSGVVSGN